MVARRLPHCVAPAPSKVLHRVHNTPTSMTSSAINVDLARGDKGTTTHVVAIQPPMAKLNPE